VPTAQKLDGKVVRKYLVQLYTCICMERDAIFAQGRGCDPQQRWPEVRWLEVGDWAGRRCRWQIRQPDRTTESPRSSVVERVDSHQRG